MIRKHCLAPSFKISYHILAAIRESNTDDILKSPQEPFREKFALENFLSDVDTLKGAY